MAGHIVQSIKNNKNDVDLFLNDKNVGVAIFQVVKEYFIFLCIKIILRSNKNLRITSPLLRNVYIF